MTGALLAGAVAGLGLYALVRVFVRPRPGVAVLVARLDAGRYVPRPTVQARERDDAADSETFGRLRRRLADRLEAETVARGWRLDRMRVDLRVMGRDLGPFLATKVLVGVFGLLWVPALWFGLRTIGIPLPPAVPVLFGLVAGGFGFFLPDLALRSEAATRRKEFRHVVGCFLDLVSMNLAGGRGLPEALLAAASVGDHWSMTRLRQVLANARLVGQTPWEALGHLGEEIGVDELRDLAGALTLAADDGAKVRASLSARAASLRRRELADLEGQAGERSQSMLVAQLLICAAFLVFLAYPATYRILHS